MLAALECALLVDRALGRRCELEPLVRDRLAALDREAVRALREPRLGALDRSQLLAQVVAGPLVELRLVRLGREVRGVLPVGELAVSLDPGGRERALDALTLRVQQLACAVGIHRATVTSSA